MPMQPIGKFLLLGIGRGLIKGLQTARAYETASSGNADADKTQDVQDPGGRTENKRKCYFQRGLTDLLSPGEILGSQVMPYPGARSDSGAGI